MNTQIITHRQSKKLFNKIMPEPNTGCWIWIGAYDNTGYGRYKMGNTTEAAHRVLFRLYKDKIQKGFLICHSCDNRFCVNPDHLFAGTHQDNADDMINKKRHIYGEKKWCAKFKESDIINVRNLYDSGITQMEIALKYNCSQSHISEITTRKQWKHL